MEPLERRKRWKIEIFIGGLDREAKEEDIKKSFEEFGCITLWCPCITFGRIAEIVDKGSTSCETSGVLYGLIPWLIGLGPWGCYYSCFYRSKMRNQYMLPGSRCGDCLVHCCCESCALCQEYRELKNRGFDMTIGWDENMERESGGVAMGPFAPLVEGGMSR
ncbi:hypothetical protein F0562_032648 [Nyssa sinensis]|uniref:RRM domain-containing protein n=1 Tax=Nyssa sinensis TaxID=561372 RepID=A0A5J5ARR8_9ASTE|nr:hypothetical protein F0562_032648 [Nyssa sinensis]